MEINKELKHIAEYQNSILPRHQKRTEEAIEIIANDAIESLKNGTFDFKSFLHLDLNQNGKHRQVIMYKPFSPEELLCIFLKRVLDRKFHISYPNRNEYIRTLFDTAAAIKDMSDYTIFISFKFIFLCVDRGAGLARLPKGQSPRSVPRRRNLSFSKREFSALTRTSAALRRFAEKAVIPLGQASMAHHLLPCRTRCGRY